MTESLRPVPAYEPSREELVAAVKRCEQWYGFAGLSDRVASVLDDNERLREVLREIGKSERGVRTYRGGDCGCESEGCRGHETRVQSILREAGFWPVSGEDDSKPAGLFKWTEGGGGLHG